MYCHTASETQRADLKLKVAQCARTKRNTFILEGEQLSPVFLVQIRASPGEVKASTCLLFIALPVWVQSTPRSPAPKFGYCLQCWVHPPGTAVTQRAGAGLCLPRHHLLYQHPRGAFLSKQRHPHPLPGFRILCLDASSKTVWPEMSLTETFPEQKALSSLYLPREPCHVILSFEHLTRTRKNKWLLYLNWQWQLLDDYVKDKRWTGKRTIWSELFTTQ